MQAWREAGGGNVSLVKLVSGWSALQISLPQPPNVEARDLVLECPLKIMAVECGMVTLLEWPSRPKSP